MSLLHQEHQTWAPETIKNAVYEVKNDFEMLPPGTVVSIKVHGVLARMRWIETQEYHHQTNKEVSWS